ncbi:MAG TPA: YciI family protein, partial [Trebonia sp.]
LRRPADAPDYDDATAEQIQRDHLAFYAALRQAGQVVTNGPVLDQPDESLRGLAVFATESADRARELANTDPAVRAGRLEIQAMTWLCPPGTMVQDGIPLSVPD